MEDIMSGMYDNINSNRVVNLVLDLKYSVRMFFDSDYKKVETCGNFNDIVLRLKQFVSNYRYRDTVFFNALETSQKTFLSTCPCVLCKQNRPCSICDEITPLDIFDMNIGYRMSCRPGSHICLGCKIKN